MSLSDARHAAEALAALPPTGRSAAQLIADRAARRRRTLQRMTDAVTRLVSLNGNFSRQDLRDQGFSEVEIDRHCRTAIARARLESMVA